MSAKEAIFWRTVFVGCDLAGVRQMERGEFRSSCSLDMESLRLGEGAIDQHILRKCGFAPWEVEAAKLFDPTLTAVQIQELQYKIFDMRAKVLQIGGVFISYARADVKFAKQIEKSLYDVGASVWRDDHKLVAGPLEAQVFDAIRRNDVVLLVLSKDSVRSDWVEAELEKALKKEREQQRSVLCPISLDDSWKARVDLAGSSVLWRQIKSKVILDFSSWESEGYHIARDKLIKGLKTHYRDQV